MDKKTFIAILFATQISFYSSANIVTKISGTVEGSDIPEKVVVIEDSSHPFMDQKWEFPVTDGKFSGEIETGYPQACYFIPSDKIMWWDRDWRFFAEGGELTVKVTTGGEEPIAELSYDMPLDNELRAYTRRLDHSFGIDELKAFADSVYSNHGEMSDEYRSLYLKHEAESNPAKKEKLQASMDSLKRIGRDTSDVCKLIDQRWNDYTEATIIDRMEYANDNPSLVGLYLIAEAIWFQNQYDHTDAFIATYKNCYDGLFPGHPYTNQINAAVEAHGCGEIALGNKYIDVEALADDGEMKKISSFIDGKVALIDLWASWCAPCRRNSISLIPLYEKYAPQGFTVIGIGREMSNDTEMRAAVAKDGYLWPNLAEINDRNFIWTKYATPNAPGKTVLVDHRGTIVAIDPSAEELDALLPELLAKQNGF